VEAPVEVSPIEEAVIVPPAMTSGEDIQPAIIEVVPVETKDESPIVKDELVYVVKDGRTLLDPSSIKDVDLRASSRKIAAEVARDAAGDIASLERKLKDTMGRKARSKKQIKTRNIKVSGLRKQIADLRRSMMSAKVEELNATLVPVQEEQAYVEQDAHIWAFKETKRKAAIRKSLELLLEQDNQELSWLMENCYKNVVGIYELKKELAIIEAPGDWVPVSVLIDRADARSSLSRATGTGSNCTVEDLMPHCEVLGLDPRVLFSLYQEMLILEEIWDESKKDIDKDIYLIALNKMRRYINN